MDARALAAIERSARTYEEARTACIRNSFPGDTQVVLADGSRKDIRDVRFGDRLLATDPDTGSTRGEPVTRTFSHPSADLLDITLASGGDLTSTSGHKFFVIGRGWTLASDLRPGDSLRTPGASPRTVAAVLDRDASAPQTVYDLTVAGLHTFYAVAGSTPVLVHNCSDLILDEASFPEQAHTLKDHVRPNQADAEAIAHDKTVKNGYDTPNSVFIDQQTAQQVVDYALANNANKIRKWMAENKTNELTWSGTFGRNNSLGTVYYDNGRAAPKATGNGFFIKLVRAPKVEGQAKHPLGYYVQTCYPK